MPDCIMEICFYFSLEKQLNIYCSIFEYLGVVVECRIAVEVMCESSDSDSDDDDVLVSCFSNNQRRERGVRILGYVENSVLLMLDDTFKSHFRVNRSTVNCLINLLGPDLSNDNGRNTISVYKQVLLILWTMATPDSYRSVCERFDVGKGTAWRTVWKFVRALYNYLPSHITWPTQTEAARNAAYIENKYGFSGVIGAVDGTHGKIVRPDINSHNYVNRKGQYSIQTQVTCDHTLKFIHVHSSEVGSVHDARAFGLSGLQNLCTPAYFPGDNHLLGDKAYNFQRCVIVPYRNDHHLGPAQIHYNRVHSSSRMIVERAIGMLKGRFRSLLDKLPIRRTDLILCYIVVYCILHDICIRQGDLIDIPIIVNGNVGVQAPLEINNRLRLEGRIKRARITNAL